MNARDAAPDDEALDEARQPKGDIQVIARSAQVLQMFSGPQKSIRVVDVAPLLGVGRTTAHRYLSSLAAAGFLERDNDGYVIGPLLVQLGVQAMSSMLVLEIAEPYLQRLCDETALTAVLGLWGGQNLVVARSQEPRDQLINLSVRVGSPLPIDSAQSMVAMSFMEKDIVERRLSLVNSAVAKQVRATSDEVLQNGFAVSDTVTHGVRSIAAPVLDGRGMLCATIAVVGTVFTVPADLQSGQVLSLLTTAEQMSRDLGYHADMPFAKHLHD